MIVIEHDIESYLVKQVKKRGGKCIKFTSPAEDGIPDRLVIIPKGRIFFVELKRPKGGRLAPIQEYKIAQLKALGCNVLIINTKEAVDNFLEDVSGDSL